MKIEMGKKFQASRLVALPSWSAAVSTAPTTPSDLPSVTSTGLSNISLESLPKHRLHCINISTNTIINILEATISTSPPEETGLEKDLG